MRIITLEEHVSTPAFLQAVDARSQRDFANEYIRRIREMLVDLEAGRLVDIDGAGSTGTGTSGFSCCRSPLCIAIVQVGGDLPMH
jgi:hypothetical protein